MKYSELERKLSKAGCQLVKSGGNHPIWFSSITGKTFPTGNHKNEKVKTGTLKSISKLSGVNI
jgi:predicted RNA binding protein YcfA (HicA-like mRNA interferase family)